MLESGGFTFVTKWFMNSMKLVHNSRNYAAYVAAAADRLLIAAIKLDDLLQFQHEVLTIDYIRYCTWQQTLY